MYCRKWSLRPEAIRQSGVLEHGYYAFLNCLIHAFSNFVLLRNIGCRIFTSNAAFLAKFDEFFRLKLSPVVNSETFQFPTSLIFDHCEPVGEDREHLIFGSDGVSPHIPSRGVIKNDEILSTTERLMWHRATNARVDQIERAPLSWC